jgi:hypothetical protein
MQKIRNAYKILLYKPDVKRSLGSQCRREKIKLGPKEMGAQGQNWDRHQWHQTAGSTEG